MNIRAIIEYLDNYLTTCGLETIEPVKANAILANAGLLSDSKGRPGKPLRELLRKGHLPHAFQSSGKGSTWTIPHSSKRTLSSSIYPKSSLPIKKGIESKNIPKLSGTFDIIQLKKQLEKSRLKYKPDNVKYLLVAEAPPDSIDRFFYYEKVRQHDYLFLGVTQALYPDQKEKFIANGRNSEIKNSILLKFKADGFYLLDLSEVPLSLIIGNLNSQLPALVEKINKIVGEKTKIILIKATVYDTAFQYLQREGFENVVDVRIPFPGQGGQKLFQIEFDKALKIAEFK